LLLALCAVTATAAELELGHDSGEREGRNSAAGNGHVIELAAPAGHWWIQSIRIHGARYGGGYDPATTMFSVAICDERLEPLASYECPYELFAAGTFAWVEVPLEPPRPAPRRFKVVVAFDPTQDRGVFVGYAATEESHSGRGLPGGSERALPDDQEWMIRAVLTDTRPRGVPEERELALDEGEPAGQLHLEDTGHVVGFQKPSGTWWIAAVSVHAVRTGDPAASGTCTLALTRPTMHPLHEQQVPVERIPTTLDWVELPLAEPIKAPSRFHVVLDCSAVPTAGVEVAYADVRRSRSYTGQVGSKAKRWREGQWMIRVRLASDRPAPARPTAPPAAGAAAYLEDLEFISRTVEQTFPAFEKKGVDWPAVCREWRPRFASCPDDRTHVLHVHQLLATLGDSHTGVTTSTVEPHVPAFDGLAGGGMWIAAEHDRLVLRAAQPDHPALRKVQPGAVLLQIGGRPAGDVHNQVCEQLRAWHGWSSQHFLDARLSFQFFPFGEADTLEATFLNPDATLETVTLSRRGAGAGSVSRQGATLPAGLAEDGPAVSTRLDERIGYLRILGSMDERTRAACFAALDQLQGVEALVLDCRGMGGGGDDPAWAMAGRFYEKRTSLGAYTTLQPTGDWQFTGPLVMLQDEREVSSAETFTWAMTETGRAIAVGRPTGGATLIPRTFDLPSGLASFRLGSHDRRTPIRGIQPEGTGTAPDVYVPYDAPILARCDDPALAVATDLLRYLLAGAPREVVVETYGGVLGLEPERLRPVIRAFARLRPQPADLALPDLTGKLVDELLAWETLLEKHVGSAPDRHNRLTRIATLLGRK
jgi:C-terminal processing protease CtpA/Prc